MYIFRNVVCSNVELDFDDQASQECQSHNLVATLCHSTKTIPKTYITERPTF